MAGELTVLVVEDDFRVGELHADVVRRTDGFRAETVRSVAETVRRLAAAAQGSAAAVDLLLVDSYLPDGSGVELIGSPALRQSGSDAIMVTADDAGTSIRRARQLGALNYLIKPFESDQLAGLLTAYGNYRTLLEREHCDQGRIDRALRALQDGNRPAGIRGQSPLTAGRIVELLGAAGSDLSAQQVAGRAGVARATAQRYLAQLAEDGVAEVFLRYGSTGRPEHRYRLRAADRA